MALRSAPYYWLECDEPNCDRRSPDPETETSAWDSQDTTLEDAENGDWWVGKAVDMRDLHYCPEHEPKCQKCGALLDTDGECEERDLHEREGA